MNNNYNRNNRITYAPRGTSQVVRRRGGRRSPEEMKLIGIALAALAAILVIVFIFTSACNSCGGCSGCGKDEQTPITTPDDIVENVTPTDVPITPPEPETDILTATNGVVNIREDADKTSGKVGAVQAGDYYNVLGTKNDSEGTVWYKVMCEGKEGYVCGTYTTVIKGKVSDGKTAYLTFDDGPSANTETILDILDTYNVKATFFVIYNESRKEMYKDIVDRGHTIALHSYTHDYDVIYKTPEAFYQDMDNLSDVIKEVTGVETKIYRFPGGSSNIYGGKSGTNVMGTIAKEMEARGYEYYDWNVDSGDADRASVDADKLVAKIKERTEGYKDAMILMHDAKTKQTTAEALPEIIEYLQSEGYEILPITEDTPPVHHVSW